MHYIRSAALKRVLLALGFAEISSPVGLKGFLVNDLNFFSKPQIHFEKEGGHEQVFPKARI
jgi:hypothetical protein